MKLIMAVIRPHRLEAVREALTAMDIHGLTASDVKGYGRQKGHTEMYRGAEYTINFVPKVKIEVAVSDDLVESALDAICEAAETGKVGDGKIFVYDLGQVVRIRTRDRDDAAL